MWQSRRERIALILIHKASNPWPCQAVVERTPGRHAVQHVRPRRARSGKDGQHIFGEREARDHLRSLGDSKEIAHCLVDVFG